MLVSTCKANSESWTKVCTGVKMFCPFACVNPPPATCSNHMCVAGSAM
jgi:hypothetical protein